MDLIKCKACGEDFVGHRNRKFCTPECKSSRAGRRVNAEYLASYHRSNKGKHAARMRERRRADPLKARLMNARHRARYLGIPFTITLRELQPLPTKCEVLGIELVYGAGGRGSPGRASLDKLRPELGYVPGNVRVISSKANTWKANMTEADLSALLSYVRRHQT
jgi:hypothetical protein